MELTIGQVVFSKSGRDKGRPFIVKEVAGEFLFLIDGKLRKLENPKKKKNIHIQKTNFVDLDMKNKLENNSYLLNSDIKKALKQYCENSL